MGDYDAASIVGRMAGLNSACQLAQAWRST